MPRFLNTHTGQFVWIGDPCTIRYAILSHTWRSADLGGEQSYQDIRKLQATNAEEKTSNDVSRNTILLHPKLSAKLKGICKVARDAGYDFVWVDSCCIDSSSSAELSEAINSMYEWYRRADVCFVYLADVSDGDDPAARTSAFSRSRWHRRGWTLQELIAPNHVVFLTSNWSPLGTKLRLATILSWITGVDTSVLAGVVGLESISVARRMSWTAGRETTRIEDEAYCLLGIFGVRMSPIYGEGRHAFLRLQEEIIRTIPDQSIFAWGPRHVDLVALDTARLRSPDIWHPREEGLLATSPCNFVSADDVTPLSIPQFANHLGRAQDDIPPLHCVFTPQGVRIRLLCLDLSACKDVIPAVLQIGRRVQENRTCDVCRGLGLAQYLGILPCVDSAGALVALPLCRPRPGPREHGSLVVATHITCGAFGHHPYHSVRLARTLAKNVLSSVLPVEVCICRTAPPVQISHAWSPQTSWGRFGNPSAVRIVPWCGDDLRTLGFSVSPVEHRLERLATGEGVLHFALTITRPRARTQRLRPSDERNSWEQYIHVQFTLAHQWHAETTFGSSRVHFAISHCFPLPPPALGPGPTGRAIALPAPFFPPPILQPETHLPPALHAQTGRSEARSRREARGFLWETHLGDDGASAQARAQATSILRSDADWTKDSFRTLRLSLRAVSTPMPGSTARVQCNVDTLWLSVELSEPSPYWALVGTGPEPLRSRFGARTVASASGTSLIPHADKDRPASSSSRDWSFVEPVLTSVPPAAPDVDYAALPHEVPAENTVAQDDVQGSRPGDAELDVSQTCSSTTRRSPVLNASPAPSGGISTNDQADADAVARLIQRVEDLQREVDNTRAEMAAMSSELRAVKTASERRPGKRRRMS